MKHLFYLGIMALSLIACTSQNSAKVYGRFVPERKDDFAWENEYAAFRMYGPALKNENPSNGVDLWLKNSPALVVDTMYGRELIDNRPYHINYDGNLDCYKVGHTVGAGGLCAMVDDNLYVAGPYSTWEILQQTNDCFSFRLFYDSVNIANRIYTEQITITARSGQIFNSAQVILLPTDTLPLPAIKLGGGIYLHDSFDNAYIQPESGLIAYCENALSDKQAARMNFEYNGSTNQGRAYLAVKTPGAVVMDTIQGCLVSLIDYTPGDTLTYYFGACWSEWSNQQVSPKTDDDWWNMLQ